MASESSTPKKEALSEEKACWKAWELAPDISAEESDYQVFEQGWNAAKAWVRETNVDRKIRGGR